MAHAAVHGPAGDSPASRGKVRMKVLSAASRLGRWKVLGARSEARARRQVKEETVTAAGVDHDAVLQHQQMPIMMAALRVQGGELRAPPGPGRPRGRSYWYIRCVQDGCCRWGV